MWFPAFLVLMFVFAVNALADAKPSPVLQAMQDELARSMENLKAQPEPPYFMSYEITDIHGVQISSSFGTIISSNENRGRQLDIDLRVGDYGMDNTHPIRGDRSGMFFMDRFSFVEIPLEDDPDAIRSLLWYHTDRRYKRAREMLTKVKTNIQVKVEAEDQSADFSKEEARSYIEEPRVLTVNRQEWEEKLKTYTAPFARYGEIYEAQANLTASRINRWHVNSEGTRIQTSRLAYRLAVSAFTKADDGMELPRYETFFSYSPEGLPDDKEILNSVERIIKDLYALREAPVVDPYTGPAILTGRASGVFFHEIFGHRVEGHRQRSEDEGQTFKKKIGEQLLPETFDVYFDPSLKNLGENDLAGYYLYDNQGVKGQKVHVVEKGVFKRFLMSRAPIEGFPSSNGHGRGQPGFSPVSRQSNLVVEVSDSVTREDLRKMLIDRIQEEEKPFGLLFDDIQGGFTMTGRGSPNAFNVLPIMVYRIYPDGREELVRGVDLIGTPLTAFSKIVAGDDTVDIFNGTCGAESGGIPVSAASPAVLVSQIEVQKKEKSQERLPLLPPPSEAQ